MASLKVTPTNNVYECGWCENLVELTPEYPAHSWECESAFKIDDGFPILEPCGYFICSSPECKQEAIDNGEWELCEPRELCDGTMSGDHNNETHEEIKEWLSKHRPHLIKNGS